ncbi:MAG: response regulator [Deltaproteobacteria bacterium]|jgi:signal transduction histidine kinase/CheY-like chemotaxis protein|nr:response regulator [Deltaproteobacteria bacterium]
MKKLRSLSFQRKVIVVFLLFMTLPFLATGYVARNMTRETLLFEKENKLLALARILEAKLGPEGYIGILRAHEAENEPADRQLAVLNRALFDFTEEVGNSAPGLGVGYYSRALDCIVTYGPTASFSFAVGLSIPPEHPGRVVMRENRPLVASGAMVRGDIMNAMVPIARGGEVIGYIWVNELTTDVTAQVNSMTRNIFLVILACSIISFIALLLLSRQTVRDVAAIINGVRTMRYDLTTRIPEAGGELGEVSRSINAMAGDIEKANRESNRAIAALQSVTGNVEAAVYVCDPSNHTLAYTNTYLNRLLNNDDPVGHTCYTTLYDYNEPCSFCPQKQLFDPEGNPLFHSVRWEHHNSHLRRDFLMTDRLVPWHDGRFLHMQVGADVTERKALVVAEAANLAQRDFLARMSHEIRTPMNGVLGMTRLAIQADPPPAQLEYLKKIQSSATLLLGIINDILDFSRIEAGKLSVDSHTFRLRDMVENIRELILPRIREKGLEFIVNIDDSVPEYATGDELRLSQVLLNLLGNASKFTLRGHVSLHMKGCLLSSGKLRLSFAVADSGIGMSQEQLVTLFKPFSQADNSTSRRFGGTGLGLSISKALVELMGGDISPRSEEGKGSIFSFHVDFDPFDGELEQPEDKRHWEGVHCEGCRFLLVEDNEINQEIALAILEDLGASVDVASNGQEGLDAFLAKDYAVIFMDVRMPVMDGLEATRRIRTSRKHDAASVPIIAMTANAMLEDRAASLEAGMNGHLAKPIDVEQLKALLFDILHQADRHT